MYIEKRQRQGFCVASAKSYLSAQCFQFCTY
jgi:hypothetical protein